MYRLADYTLHCIDHRRPHLSLYTPTTSAQGRDVSVCVERERERENERA